MFRFIKEIYLTTFTIFSRIGGWSPRINAASSVVIIVIIESGFALGISLYILDDLEVKTRIPKPLAYLAYFALGIANYYFLIIRGHGLKFDREFKHFDRSKKIRLVISSLVAVILAVLVFVLTAQAHRRLLGVRD